MTKEEAYRYIDNLKWLKGYDNTTIGGKPVGEILDEIEAMLKEKETVVRCKDCRYYNSRPDSEGDHCDKIHWSRGINWFCADGKRRIDDA